MPRQFQIKRPFAKKTKKVAEIGESIHWKGWITFLKDEKDTEQLALKLSKIAGKQKRLIKKIFSILEKIGKQKDIEKRKKYKPKLEQLIKDSNDNLDAQAEIIETIENIELPNWKSSDLDTFDNFILGRNEYSLL